MLPKNATKTFICLESKIDHINAAIQAASRAFPTWRAQSGRQRGRILRKIFDLIVENNEDIGKIITAENGKTKGEAKGKALFLAGFFEWFSEEAPRIYGDVIPHSNPSCRTQVVKEPVGVAAALAAGCTVVMKSDGLTPFTPNALAILAEREGVPKGVFNVVTALDNTPSPGRLASTLKKLSLGGNAPFIVLDDADLETAVTSAVTSKFKVTGQTCVCANRFFIQEGIYEKLSQRFVEEMKKSQVGDGQNTVVTHDPLTNGVEKTFGPLAALSKFTTKDEVVDRANN
ncbi:aldehyde dehydrogenase [Penicillium malachiteum]|uniref:aldehyde dehydrogenase n=1 Tax=Penicillium malachiteum TaxID=1324776 RepID=UPI0025495606|nr:aldehyde dehydrogenase [Penicillium malachiteum]KAJ5720631.1 aldehyde dehydrogenase [Penicillium malachiteum]